MTPRNGLLTTAMAGAFCLLLSSQSALQAQPDYGYRLGDRVGGRLNYRVPGVSTYMEALDPSIQRWYLPSVHFSEAGRQQWQYTNWARDRQQRYVNAGLEGDNYYDFFGDLVTRGWVVYSWQQVQPVIASSSGIVKAQRYIGLFNRLVVASDISRGRGFTIIVGDEINMTLTPMTFRKAGYNGVITEYTAERFHVTGLFSRIGFPIVGQGGATFQNFTNLAGGRATADVTDFMTLGLTFVNSHNGTGAAEAWEGNAFTGRLNSEQLSQRLELLVLRLSDDSPEDAEGGAMLFSDDLEISTTIVRDALIDGETVMVETDTVFFASSIDFRPAVEGGRVRQGFLTADGGDDIVMKYLLAPEDDDPDDGSTLRAKLQQHLDLSTDEAEATISRISNIRAKLVLANDYRVEMSSNRQTDRFGVPQFRVVARAEGNIKNQLNQREVVFDYGIPTATQILGFTTEIRDFHGIDFYGEANLNTQFRKYPSEAGDRAISGIQGDKHAIGWMANLSWRQGPASLYVEGFGMDDEYSTSVLPLRRQGTIDYSPEATNELYDFVDDNDDNDRHPDQLRIGEGSQIPQQGFSSGSTIQERGRADPEVFPGYDENGDFISDFNQNNIFDSRNLFPDYDEPFLRYRSDRPEFLYGIDLNNNGWVERFENDDDPDYPYKKDHHGYNANGGLQFGPDAKLRLGRLQQDMHKSKRRNTTKYAMLAVDHDDAFWGRFRVFDLVKLAKDDIPDHLVQWVIPRTEFGQAADTAGRLTPILDRLAARDTWINTLYAEWSYGSPRGWTTLHRFKWDRWHQRDAEVEYGLDEAGDRLLDEAGDALVLFDPLGPEGRNGREDSGFFGIINKADYLVDLGLFQLDPRFKSEYLRETPFDRNRDKRRSWDGLFFLQARIPVLRQSQLQLGYEQRFFYNLHDDEGDMTQGQFTGDFRGSAFAVQLSNTSEYKGYDLTLQGGIRIDSRSLEIVDDSRQKETAGLSFVTIFAGLD